MAKSCRKRHLVSFWGSKCRQNLGHVGVSFSCRFWKSMSFWCRFLKYLGLCLNNRHFLTQKRCKFPKILPAAASLCYTQFQICTRDKRVQHPLIFSENYPLLHPFIRALSWSASLKYFCCGIQKLLPVTVFCNAFLLFHKILPLYTNVFLLFKSFTFLLLLLQSSSLNVCLLLARGCLLICPLS